MSTMPCIGVVEVVENVHGGLMTDICDSNLSAGLLASNKSSQGPSDWSQAVYNTWHPVFAALKCSQAVVILLHVSTVLLAT